MSSNSLPSEIRIIDDLETLRLLTQPLRLRVIEELRVAPAAMTAKELATSLGTSQTKLYYHLNLLEEAGLIRVAETRLVSGITEKRYEAAAFRLGVDRSLLGAEPGGGDGLEVLLAILLDQVRSEIRRSVRAGLIDLGKAVQDDIAPGQLTLGRKWLRLTPEQVAELSERYAQLFAGYTDQLLTPHGSEPWVSDADAQFYELLIGFYPTVSPPGDGKESPPPERD